MTDFGQVDFDGLVVESPRGDRLLALPIAVLEVLRYAAVIQYKRGGSVYRMRVDSFLDKRQGGHPVTHAKDVIQEAAEQAANSAGATIEALPIPSPTPPPAPGEEQMEPPDPANIPLRVRRNGLWENIYVTRTQYDEYQRQGRISQDMPADKPQEGTEQ